MDVNGIEGITEFLNDFARGNPQHFEIEVLEGVFFDFDCPFADDLIEPMIPIAVGIQEWSVHNHGEPEKHRLMNYSEEMDELTCPLDEAFYNAGSRNEELVLEYSPNNSQNEMLMFLGSIHNPRMDAPNGIHA